MIVDHTEFKDDQPNSNFKNMQNKLQYTYTLKYSIENKKIIILYVFDNYINLSNLQNMQINFQVVSQLIINSLNFTSQF